VNPQSSEQLLVGPSLREFILICGKDSVGKSSAIVSLAWYIEQIDSDAKFYVIDLENKFRSALKGFGTDAPKNIIYYKCDDMNQATEAMSDIVSRHKRGDWIAVESMSRLWEKAQDMGYQAIVGTGKADYMEKRRAKAGKKDPVTPKPDELWSIIKGAHDSAFLDILSMSETLNVILSTTIAKPPKADSFMKENADRKAARVELGMDAGVEGAPRLPYYVETLCLLELNQGKVTCRMLRDNLSVLDDSRISFEVPGKKEWAANLYVNCR
jgi:hypothetical protein